MDGATPTGPRFKGQSIDLGGKTYIMPPLALGAVKDLIPRIQKLSATSGMPSAEDIDTMVDTAHAAIRRNYPELTREELLDMLDLGNVRPVFRMLMGQSGFETVSAEGNASPGTAAP